MRALLLSTAILFAAEHDAANSLHDAVYRDDLAAARKLVAGGADPKAANRYGATPLSLACTNGNAAMIEMLLAAGADPNAALPGGETPLMTAARTGKLDAVKALLKRGANINAKEKSGQTALMWAAAEGYASVVETLIEFGADSKARVNSGFTAFLFAVREGRLDAVKSFLKSGTSPNEAIERDDGAARRATQGRGWPRIGTSALVLAVTNAHFELAAHLLDAGADPNAAATGYTALHVIPTVRKPGVGDNDPAPYGSGKLNSLDMVKKLVAKGANINARMTKRVNFGLTAINTNGATPFFLAARTADAELMRLLASLGADPKIPNENNSTPLIAAAGLGTRSPGEDSGTEPEVMEAVQVALELGNDIDAVDDNGETAMHGAAYKNLPAVVELLAAKGAKISVWNKKNRFGWTPLTIAEGYRFGNYKPSPPTIAAFHKVMLAAGVTPMETPESERKGR